MLSDIFSIGIIILAGINNLLENDIMNLNTLTK